MTDYADAAALAISCTALATSLWALTTTIRRARQMRRAPRRRPPHPHRHRHHRIREQLTAE